MGRDDYNSTYQSGGMSDSAAISRACSMLIIFAGQNVELEPLAPNGQQYGQQGNANDILKECEGVRNAIQELTGRRLQELQQAQRAVLSDPDSSSSSPASRELERQSSQIMQEYRDLTARMKRIKSKPESGSPRNSAQVGSTSRALKTAINQYQSIDGQFTKNLKEQMARQYRIVRPEASEQEVREAVEDTSSQQVFSQALLQGNRRGQAQSALNAVQSRHEAIQKIERQMIELAELFQDMENMVVQQEAAVTNIEMKGEEVVENMDNGTKQIDVAVKTARATRKKKWWCLAICGMSLSSAVTYVLVLNLHSHHCHHHRGGHFALAIRFRSKREEASCQKALGSSFC